ncbi:unnamed protein product, partial [Durusdinium trenchii]
VTLGAKASLLVGDLVTIRADQLPGFVGEDRPYLHSVARSDAPPVEVNAALSAPSEVNPCIPIRLSSELSTGDSGRSMLAEWRLGNTTGLNDTQLTALWEQVYNATNSSDAVLELNFLAQDVHQPHMDASIEVIVGLTNWLRQSDSARATVRVSSAYSAPPLRPVAPSIEVKASDPVELAVEVQANPCASGGLVQITWAVWPQGTLTGWRSLEAFGLQDQRPQRQTAIHIASNSFDPDTKLNFRATAVYEGYTAMSEQIFEVTILPPARPLAVISSPSSVSKDCRLVLKSVSAESNLRHSWRCSDCHFVGFDLAALPESDSEVTIPGGSLNEGTYNFSLEVWRPDAREHSGESQITVAVVSASRPAVILSFPFVAGGAVSTRFPTSVDVEVTIEVEVVTDSECPVNDASWSWAVYHDNDNSTPSEPLESLRPSPGKSNSRINIPMNSLKKGGMYYFALLDDDGSILAKSPSFRADGPPVPGVVEVEPRQGQAVTTSFTIATHSWQDEDEESLQYSLYAFPTEKDVREVDYTDPSSEQYFSKHSGVLLRGWARSKRTSEIRMRPGNFTLVVRCRDDLHAEAEIMLTGWSITAAEIDAKQVEKVLQASVSSADGQQIVMTVSAIVESKTSGPSSIDMVNALQVAAENIDPESEVLENMASVASAVVGSGAMAEGENASKTVDAAADLLDDIIQLSGSEGVDQQVVGKAVLGEVKCFNCVVSR